MANMPAKFDEEAHNVLVCIVFVTLSANHAAIYIAPCSPSNRKLILTAMLLKFSQINLKMMDIQKVGK